MLLLLLLDEWEPQTVTLGPSFGWRLHARILLWWGLCPPFTKEWERGRSGFGSTFEVECRWGLKRAGLTFKLSFASPHPAAPDGHQSALKYYTRRPKTKAAPSADLPSSSPQPSLPPDQEAPIDLWRGVRSCTTNRFLPSVNAVSTDSKVKEPTPFRSA